MRKAYEWSVLYIDDGSQDDTLERIVKLAGTAGSNVRYISFARNFGKESAIYAGLENADGDYVALMDADLQHPPHLLVEMLHAIEVEGYDCATARRVNREKESKIRNFFSNAFYHTINWATGMKLAPGMTDYRLMKKQVVDAIVSMREHERFIKGIYSWIGFKSKWVEYENVERADGDSKWNYKSLWNYAKTGIIAFAVSPLRAVIYFGFLVIGISFVYAVRLFLMSISGARPWQDTTTIILLLLFLGGVIILLLGVIGEYLARIYMEVKNRPIYIAKEKKLDK
ncbi:glycosyltransferase family 2 protein [Butyrivibrio fibrisolvens]|uniref:glycosyltransferase family 2 protein n=1 Tax=Butyrivibrio fibrisolvens TaxID=831 RepID=UPI0005565E5C|nr:glycosyltransferase family 2 protein [Butyrivibrio fibrisolvens]